MELSTIVALVTMVVTFICGIIAKKVSWFDNKLIPIQNLAIGIIASLIEFIITKDFKGSIAMVGLMTGGTYDLIKNLNNLLNGE